MLKFYVYGTLRDNKAMSKAHEGAAYIEEKLPGVKIGMCHSYSTEDARRKVCTKLGWGYNPSMGEAYQSYILLPHFFWHDESDNLDDFPWPSNFHGGLESLKAAVDYEANCLRGPHGSNVAEKIAQASVEFENLRDEISELERRLKYKDGIIEELQHLEGIHYEEKQGFEKGITTLRGDLDTTVRERDAARYNLRWQISRAERERESGPPCWTSEPRAPVR